VHQRFDHCRPDLTGLRLERSSLTKSDATRALGRRQAESAAAAEVEVSSAAASGSAVHWQEWSGAGAHPTRLRRRGLQAAGSTEATARKEVTVFLSVSSPKIEAATVFGIRP
jgi:hypothetical protein